MKAHLTFEDWLNEVTRIAMGAEWQINRDYHRWQKWFESGLSPHEAVTCLFELVRTGKQ